MAEGRISGDGAPTVLGDGAWTYTWAGVPRPFVHPVRSPAGRVLTVDAPADHPWHHALWCTIKFVNGDNFWEEYGEFGVLHQAEPPSVTREADGHERAEAHLDWVPPGASDPVLRQTLALTHVPLGDDAHALDWLVALTACADATLDRTPFTTWGGYGGLTLRGRPDWHDTTLRLADGAPRERVLGDPSPWLALDGPLGGDDGDAVVGVVLMDHPTNVRFPTPWYASTRAATYGDEGWSNFANAAVLWDEPLTLAADETLTLRHRVLVHDGAWETERIDAAWHDWAATPPAP